MRHVIESTFVSIAMLRNNENNIPWWQPLFLTVQLVSSQPQIEICNRQLACSYILTSLNCYPEVNILHYGHNVKEVVGLYDIINVCLVYIENNKVRRDH